MDAQTIVAFVFGFVFIVVMLTIGCVIAFRENPRDIPPTAMLIFRVVLALAAAGVAATLPGFLEIESNLAEFGLRAGRLCVDLLDEPPCLRTEACREGRLQDRYPIGWQPCGGSP